MELETLQSCNLCGSEQIQVLDAESNLSTCELCGYVFDNPRPVQAEIVRFYSKAEKYEPWLAEEKARDLLWQRRLRKMLKNQKPGTLLDVGTGTGQFLHHAKHYYSAVYGTEISESAIRIAQQKYGLNVMKGSIESINFGTMKFDNITLFHVLEHVPNPKSVIERCRNLLNAGGMIVIAVPNDLCAIRPKLKRLVKAIVRSRALHAGKYDLPRITLDGSIQEIHLSHFTPGVLTRFLRQHGFSILENTLDPYFVATGRRLLRERLYYDVCWLLSARTNAYDTILVVAQKN